MTRQVVNTDRRGHWSAARRRLSAPLALAVMLALAVVAVAGGLFATPEQARAESGPANSWVRGEQTWYAYVQAGETFSADFTLTGQDAGVGWGDNSRVQVKDPQGNVVKTCDFTYNSTRVTECRYTSGPQATAGVFSVSLGKLPGNTSSSPLGRPILAWDVSVTHGAERKSGRVWSEQFVMEDSPSTPVDLTLFYQTVSGFTYRADHVGMVGIASRYVSSAFGNVHAEDVPGEGQPKKCDSAYQSIPNNSLRGSNKNLAPGYSELGIPADKTGCKFTPFKIFFEEPSKDLPAEATLPGSDSPAWLRDAPMEAEDVQVTDFTFEPASPGSRAGTISFRIPRHEGVARVQVDVNDNGEFDDENDREFQTRVLAGQDGKGELVTIAFNGMDAKSVAIAPTTPLAVRVTVDRIGEVHFTAIDLEVLANGLKVERLNGWQPGPSGLSWDDSMIEEQHNGAVKKCSRTAATTGDGVDSSQGVHGWNECESGTNVEPWTSPNPGHMGSWGNLAAIDNWTSIPVDHEIIVEIPAFKISKTSSPATGAAVTPAERIEYSITAEPVQYSHPGDVNASNPRWVPATTWSGRYVDSAASVADGATIDWDSLKSSPAAHSKLEPNTTSNQFTWTGEDVPIGPPVVTSYSATVKPVAEQGESGLLHNRADIQASNFEQPKECIKDLCGETRHALLEVEKSSTPTDGQDVAPGQEVAYTITFTNRGSQRAPVDYEDRIADVVDEAVVNAASLTATNGLTAEWNAEGTIISVKGGLPASNASGPATGTVTYTVKVKDAGFKNGTLRNYVVRPTADTPEACDPKDVLCTEHPITGGYTVTKTSDPESGVYVSPGNVVKYTVTAVGTGTGATGISLTDDLTNVLKHANFTTESASLKVGKADPAPVSDPGTEQKLVAGPFDLAEGETATLTYEVVVKLDAWSKALANVVTGVDENGKPPATCDPCATRTPVTARIEILKVGRGINGAGPLGGSAWTVHKDVAGAMGAELESPRVTPISVDGQVQVGRFEFTEALPGTYWLMETQTQAGFSLLAAPVRFVIGDDGTVSLPDQLAHGQAVSVAGNSGVAVITVENTAAVILPRTGDSTGDGPHVMVGASVLVVAMSAIALRELRRRGAARTRRA
ncbi:prealbumin-like fold domain-containing protein [Xylanimonas ulmi]|uniref:DUF7927 domain-containing protein n=1 Tax=Xylanimonas ulmi TaxID=228973 RepID=A0A4V2EYG5_9MICO|nr:prealbumin-like fold domain-containing protein [Xylanibacterium ulmi]RZS62910.1 hypothetical protein EV386_3266 [Xylanibacterium ulmi]